MFVYSEAQRLDEQSAHSVLLNALISYESRNLTVRIAFCQTSCSI